MPLFVEELTKTVLEAGLLDGRGRPLRARRAGCRRWRSRRRCTTRSWPGSTDSRRRPRRWRRSAPPSAASSPTSCSRRWRRCRRRSCGTRWTSWSRRSWSSAAARRPRRSTASSTRWCRTRPTRACSGASAGSLHARIAQVLEERFPATAEAEPELLAHHCAQAGLVEKAAGYRHKAGQRVAIVQPAGGRDSMCGPPPARRAPRRYRPPSSWWRMRRSSPSTSGERCTGSATPSAPPRPPRTMRCGSPRRCGPTWCYWTSGSRASGTASGRRGRSASIGAADRITAYADPQTRARAAATGPSGFVSKPFSAEILKRAVDQALADRLRP